MEYRPYTVQMQMCRPIKATYDIKSVLNILMTFISSNACYLIELFLQGISIVPLAKAIAAPTKL